MNDVEKNNEQVSADVEYPVHYHGFIKYFNATEAEKPTPRNEIELEDSYGDSIDTLGI